MKILVSNTQLNYFSGILYILNSISSGIIPLYPLYGWKYCQALWTLAYVTWYFENYFSIIIVHGFIKLNDLDLSLTYDMYVTYIKNIFYYSPY